MGSEHELHRDGSLLLTSEDRANGFSIVGNESHNVTLLKEGSPIAWFAATVTAEVIVAFLKLIKDSKRSDKSMMAPSKESWWSKRGPCFRNLERKRSHPADGSAAVAGEIFYYARKP